MVTNRHADSADSLRNFYGRVIFWRENAPRRFTASAPGLQRSFAIAGSTPMWTAPALKSFIKSVSARERHPSDEEFFILSHVQPEGHVVGRLGELAIPSHVMGEDGQHYAFEGVAARRPSGRFDVDALRPGEWIVRPGLVYRQIGERRTRRP